MTVKLDHIVFGCADLDTGAQWLATHLGAEAAARHAFRVGPDQLQPWQAARLAAVLPNPKARSASRPSNFVKRRASSIADGAATILQDGRADCLKGAGE